MEEIKGVKIERSKEDLKELDLHIAFAEQQITTTGNRGGERDIFKQIKNKFEVGEYDLTKAKEEVDMVLFQRNER